jgi:hypothetical protein
MPVTIAHRIVALVRYLPVVVLRIIPSQGEDHDETASHDPAVQCRGGRTDGGSAVRFMHREQHADGSPGADAEPA